MTDLSPETVGKLVALAARKGGRGPHMDRTEATLSQLAQWADDAAANITNGWKCVEHFSGHMGGWEQSLLRHIATELRGIAAVLPEPADPDVAYAKAMFDAAYPNNVAWETPSVRDGWIRAARFVRGRALAAGDRS